MAFPVKPRKHLTQPANPALKLIPLTRGKAALVDAANYERLNQHRWYVCREKRGDWRAVRTQHRDRTGRNNYRVYMAREILGLALGDPRQVDHRNHETLDNTEVNLRIATLAQNTQNKKLYRTNRCGFKGVRQKKNRWEARIQGAHCGSHLTAEAAALAYDTAAIFLQGYWSHQNFPLVAA